jgi:hypothetical protein
MGHSIPDQHGKGEFQILPIQICMELDEFVDFNETLLQAASPVKMLVMVCWTT